MYRLKKDTERIKNIRDHVFKKWTEKYWEFILENENKKLGR